MSEKSYLRRIRKEIIHSIKTQQHAFEVFLDKEFDLVLDVSFCPDELAFTQMLPNLTVD